MKKAQVWYIDYMIASFIFIMAMVLYFEVTTNLAREDEGNLNEMILDSATISTGILSNGHPNNWTVDTVERIGITSDDRIDLVKYAEFGRILYKDAVYLFGTTFDFYMVLRDRDGSVLYRSKLCGFGHESINLSLVSTEAFAYYRKSSGTGIMTPWFAGFNVAVYDETNQSEFANRLRDYSFVVLEDAELPVNLTINLSRYVSGGGAIIASENIIDNETVRLWNVTFSKEAGCTNGNASVISNHSFINLSIGDTVNFEDCPSVTGDIYGLANLTNTTYGIAWIEFEAGKVFYFSDFNGSTTSVGIDEVVAELVGYHITGKCENLDPMTIESEDLVTANRLIVDQNTLIKMEVYMWE